MIIIPARLGSSRFNNKILVDIMGLPMVVRTAKQVESLDRVVVATDSIEVKELVNSYGIEAVLTDINHNSGTDRINEAAKILNLSCDEVIINVQADEPFIECDVVQSVINDVKKVKDRDDILVSSCYKIISSELADDTNHVKVITNSNNLALYFSRSKIPHNRDHYHNIEYKGHLGIYGFTAKKLDKFCNLKNSILESTEKLEQLRVLEFGYQISMVEVESRSFGIDTQEDLNKALEIFG
jgi:3-deoxy-manno-octulosonate cytidylyltransferase (CMP-KDO synthetase)